ncbi:hypothetical protein [Phaeacidiphilus oryzae]|uniref:hypothetical protein n=1 Tax=Phaeacidiphilus oryzae TaxID=348818 RepID=UPI00056AC565|nr:hypothetical protein [Phaeacidiphilus oryzae]
MSAFARVIRIAANLAALVLVVWIVLALAKANTGNGLVGGFREAADWLATWSRGMFDVHNPQGQIILDFGLAALVYALVGNIIGSRGK